MNPRTLLHILLVAVVAVVILKFPEQRSTESLADYASGGEPDLSGERPERARDALDELPLSTSFPGIRGEAIGLDGAGVAGLRVEAVPRFDLAQEDEPEAAARLRSTTSQDDGSFELFNVDPDSTLAVRSTTLALLCERRRVQPDGSISALLVLAPTSPVAGRVSGGRPGQRVILRANHDLPLAARTAEVDRELVFEREVETRSDGSFDFGRVPCSNSTLLETDDGRGGLRRASVPYEGTLTVNIDLRQP